MPETMVSRASSAAVPSKRTAITCMILGLGMREKVRPHCDHAATMPPASMPYDLNAKCGNVRGVHETKAGCRRYGKRDEADEQVDADGAVRIERKDRDENWQSGLGAAEADEPAKDCDGRAGRRRSERAADRIEAFARDH